MKALGLVIVEVNSYHIIDIMKTIPTGRAID
jgi:hypothetical protein